MYTFSGNIPELVKLFLRRVVSIHKMLTYGDIMSKRRLKAYLHSPICKIGFKIFYNNNQNVKLVWNLDSDITQI